MQKEEINKQPQGLTFLDQVLVHANFQKKLTGVGEANIEETIEQSKKTINDIIYSCTELAVNIKELSIWNKREDVVHFFDKLNSVRHTLMEEIALTSGKENLLQQADRFKTPIQKLLTLYALALEEVEKRKDVLDPVSQIPIAMEPDIEEYKKVLEDDIMQDIDSTNHMILNLLKADPTTHPKLKEILLNY